LQDPPKFTQIRSFGLKICHLATLFRREKLKEGAIRQKSQLDIFDCLLKKREMRRKKMTEKNEKEEFLKSLQIGIETIRFCLKASFLNKG
jgi:hypothetical protein